MTDWKTRLQSPVLWAGVFTTLVAQLKVLEEVTQPTWITYAMLACTVVISFFTGLNNPDSTREF